MKDTGTFTTSRSRAVPRLAAALACGTLLAACGGGAGGSPVGGSPVGGGPACDPAAEFCGNVPLSANACGDTPYWPLSLQSGQRPLTVHYSRMSDRDTAAEVLALVEASWTVQVDQLGFDAPLDDAGACGADGAYDVFLWPGVDGAYVESVADNPLTPYNDYSTYMAIDPYGAYGGEFLDTTLAHEFNHAVQASDDWWESALIFEMTATFAEALVYPAQDDYFFTLVDFQERPDRAVFFDDGYRTWHMYGAAMFLHYLYERHFAGDPGFIARVWRAMRSDPQDNRPDYLDALRSVLLNERGVELDAAVVEFMQWRWYVAEFDDGAHFAQGAAWPVPVSYLQADAADASIVVDFRAMHYGAGYLLIVNDAAVERNFAVQFDPAGADAAWRLTTADGSDVAAAVAVPAHSSRVLVATALPAAPVAATALSTARHGASLRLTAQ